MPNEKMTLIERLRNPSRTTTDSGLDGHVPRLDETATLAVMREAADEIERLQRLAGAISPGESFQELKGKAR